MKSIANNLRHNGITLQLQKNENGSKRAYIYCGNSEIAKKYGNYAGNVTPYNLNEEARRQHLYLDSIKLEAQAKEKYIESKKMNNQKLEDIDRSLRTQGLTGSSNFRHNIGKLEKSNNYDLLLDIDPRHASCPINSSITFDNNGNIIMHPTTFSGDKLYAAHGKDRVEVNGILNQPSQASKDITKAVDAILKKLLEKD